jgi:hypothetical protein
MTITTLADSWAETVESLPIDIGDDVLGLVRSAFYRGALAATTSGLSREQLMAELVAHGRIVGTPAERARA